jgi:subtilisin-like proprotein convertase family protein
MKSLPVSLLSSLMVVSAAHGAVLSVGALIPDGNSSGLASVQTLTGTSGSIQSVTVQLNVSGVGDGAFNGDLYVTLQHDSGFAVLLNRPGRTALDAFGYGDNGLSVTFDDSGSAPDVHTYRLGGTPAGPLTGTWSSDGRSVDPAVVTEASPRTATLSAFNGLDPNGTWILFLADLEPGGTAMLDSWELRTTSAAIPEPGLLALGTSLVLAAYGLLRSRRRAADSGIPGVP